jgi:hypothetical protein
MPRGEFVAPRGAQEREQAFGRLSLSGGLPCAFSIERYYSERFKRERF